MSLPRIKNHDSILLRGDGETCGTTCERHDIDHYEDEPCPVCYERYTRAQEIKETRKRQRSSLYSAFSDMGDAFKMVRKW